MNNINPLLDAVGDIGDSFITAARITEKRPIVLIIAATAAALALITGAAVIYNHTNGVSFNGSELFEYDYTVQEDIVIPEHEELIAAGARFNRGDLYLDMTYEFTALPSEVFRLYNISPLMNDNFTEDISEVTVDYSCWNVKEDIPESITLYYSLTDINNGAAADFTLHCKLSESAGTYSYVLSVDMDINGILIPNNDFEREILTLKDGSQALIHPWFTYWTATFAYDGIVYNIDIDHSSSDEIKQVLSDLGVL